MPTAIQLMLLNAVRKKLFHKEEPVKEAPKAGKLLAAGFALGAVTTACAAYAVSRALQRRKALSETVSQEEARPTTPEETEA